MKKIYILFVLLNVLVMGGATAQTNYPYCNLNYNWSTITYQPDSFYLGTNVPFQMLNGYMSDTVPIGFPFNFYGNDYSKIVVSPYGHITFNDTMANHHPLDQTYNVVTMNLPFSNYPHNSIFMLCGYYYTSVVANVSTIKYNTTGISPNRKFVLAYDSIKALSMISGPDAYMTGEIILYETSNIIEMHIKFAPDPSYYGNGQRTDGIQNSTATRGYGGYDPGAIHYAERFSPFNAPLPSIPICIVSVDSASGKNLVVWDQPAGIPVDSTIIYRETTQANVYTQIGVQLRSAFSTFLDTGSNPQVQANRYKLGFRDSCGTVSLSSANHKTVHLNVNAGIGNSWNLSWDAYEGFTFPSYNIYRGTSSTNLTLLTTIASNLYAYTDLTPPSTVYYAIEVVNPGGCNPSYRVASNYNSSLSNVVNPAITTGIGAINNNDISIFPNPATNSITLHSQLSILNSQFLVTDVLGNIIYQQTLSGIDTKIDVSKWSEGVYFYEVRGSGLQIPTSVRGKFVKQ